MRYQYYRRTTSGFSLIEMVITTVILGILLAIGMPSMQRFSDDAKVRSVGRELAAGLWQARAQAQSLQQTVTVCARSTQGACSSSKVDWKNGWIVYVGGVLNKRPATASILLESTLDQSRIALGVDNPQLSFAPNGGALAQTISVSCQNCQADPRTLTIARNGQVTIS
ncbi:GspH/FimT family pseudopilin [Craterilacuibacter sp.]|uniref:GspH/FimT family pseudopilin n=1 Tax=Craterilacuibacter sp. TaxID=2870909 RepID=UPI003F3222AE